MEAAVDCDRASALQSGNRETLSQATLLTGPVLPAGEEGKNEVSEALTPLGPSDQCPAEAFLSCSAPRERREKQVIGPVATAHTGRPPSL